MNNVHPRVFERLRAQLPEGAAVLSVTPLADRTTVTYVIDGVETKADMPKASLDRFLGNTTLEVTVPDGTLLNDALAKLSERYHLFWVSGVDYPDTDKVISFADLSGFEGTDERSNFVNYQLDIPATSPLWTGSVVVRFFQEAKPSVGGVPPMMFCLADQRVQLMLSSKVFEGEGEVLTSNKDCLTLVFAKKVIAYLKEQGVTSLKPNDLGQADIIDVVADGFSGIVVVKPKKGPTLFIRYRSTGEDLNIPTPGDEDSE